MKHSLLLLCGLGLLAAAAPAQDADEFVIQVKPKIGTTYRFKVIEDRNSVRSRAGKTERHDERVVRVFRIEAKAEEEGGTLCRFMLESMIHEVTQGNSQARYDSTQNPSEKLKRERKVEVPVDFVVSPEGRIVEIRAVGSQTGLLTPSDQVEIREGWLRHSLQGMFAPYPTRALKVGDTWTSTSNSTLVGNSVSFRATNTITERVSDTVIKLKQDKNASGKPGGAYRENKTLSEGEAELDLEDGLLRSYTLNDQWSAVRLSGVRWERNGKTQVTRLGEEGGAKQPEKEPEKE